MPCRREESILTLSEPERRSRFLSLLICCNWSHKRCKNETQGGKELLMSDRKPEYVSRRAELEQIIFFSAPYNMRHNTISTEMMRVGKLC